MNVNPSQDPQSPALAVENADLRAEVDGLRRTFTAWQEDAKQFAAEFPGVDWTNISDFIPHIRAERRRAEKQESALHQCYTLTGEEAGDVDDFRALVNREEHVVDAVRRLQDELKIANAKFAHFVRPDTLPKSIDDASMREWYLASRISSLEELDRSKSARISDLERRLEAMHARADQRERLLEVERKKVSQREEQLLRICREGFGLDHTIGGEPADDYVIRMIGVLKRELSALQNERGTK